MGISGGSLIAATETLLVTAYSTMVFLGIKCNNTVNTRGQQSLPGATARPEAALEVLAAAGRVGERTVDIVAVIEVLIL